MRRWADKMTTVFIIRFNHDYTCLGSAVRRRLIRAIHVVNWAYEYLNANDENQYHNPSFGSEW